VVPGPESGTWGAFHTSDVPYEMNALKLSDRIFTEADYKIADMMSSYWANFIATGNPNGKGLPQWQSVTESPGMTMELGDNSHSISATGSKEKLEFFEKFLKHKAATKQ
jgi:para-nitrobenzyl esterase